MYNIAYDKVNKKILGFIKAEGNIDLEEVFANFQNYEIIKTEQTPPIIDYEKYKVDIVENNISFSIFEEVLSEIESKKQQLRDAISELRNTNQTLLDFLEGEISIVDYAETKLKRRNLRTNIKKLEIEIAELNMRGEGANGR